MRACLAVTVATLLAACGTGTTQLPDDDPAAGATAEADRDAGADAPTTDGAAGPVQPLDDAAFDHTVGAATEPVEGPAVDFPPYPDADVREIAFTAPEGDRVTGLIAHPVDGPSAVGVLVLPGLPETAAQNVEPLALLSCAGVTGLVVDPPYVRDGRLTDPLTFDETDREEQVRYVLETRRALDLLEDAGATTIGLHGVSWGVSIASLLAGVDDRVDAAALMVGHGGLVERFTRDGEPIHPLSAEPEDQQRAWIEEMAPLDATLYVGEASARFLFQNGRTDPAVTPASAERLHRAAPEGSEVRWYDVGHEVPPEMIADNWAWLGEQLGLDPDRVDTCVAAMPSSRVG